MIGGHAPVEVVAALANHRKPKKTRTSMAKITYIIAATVLPLWNKVTVGYVPITTAANM